MERRHESVMIIAMLVNVGSSIKIRKRERESNSTDIDYQSLFIDQLTDRLPFIRIVPKGSRAFAFNETPKSPTEQKKRKLNRMMLETETEREREFVSGVNLYHM